MQVAVTVERHRSEHRNARGDGLALHGVEVTGVDRATDSAAEKLDGSPAQFVQLGHIEAAVRPEHHVDDRREASVEDLDAVGFPACGPVGAGCHSPDARLVGRCREATQLADVVAAVRPYGNARRHGLRRPESHRGETTLHRPRKIFQSEIYIPEAIIDHRILVLLEVGAGGMVLLHKKTEHGSLENDSDGIR